MTEVPATVLCVGMWLVFTVHPRAVLVTQNIISNDTRSVIGASRTVHHHRAPSTPPPPSDYYLTTHVYVIGPLNGRRLCLGFRGARVRCLRFGRDFCRDERGVCRRNTPRLRCWTRHMAVNGDRVSYCCCISGRGERRRGRLTLMSHVGQKTSRVTGVRSVRIPSTCR